MLPAFAVSVLILAAQDDAARIRILIRGLTSDRQEIRLDAERRLVELGEPVIPALIKASRNNDPELVPQAQKVVRRITGRKSAIRDALLWLTKRQEEDGSWRAPYEDTSPGLTGVVALAFLKGGASPAEEGALRKALAYLARNQDPEGCLVDRKAQKFVLSHALATLALCEALPRLASEESKKRIRKSVEFLLAARNPGRGWRYASRCIDNDTHVTTWAVLALRSAGKSEFRIPESAYDGARAWLREVRDENGRAGYWNRGATRIFDPRFRGHTLHPNTMTAMGLLGWTLLGEEESAEAAHGIVLADPPRWDTRGTDFYYWFFGTLSLAAFERVQGRPWKEWRERLVNLLLDRRAFDGSWSPPKDSIEIREGGPVYATAMAVLALGIAMDRQPKILNFGR